MWLQWKILILKAVHIRRRQAACWIGEVVSWLTTKCKSCRSDESFVEITLQNLSWRTASRKAWKAEGTKRHTQVAARETPGDLCRNLAFQICSLRNISLVTHAMNFLYSGTLSENHHRFLCVTWRRVGYVDCFQRAAVRFLEQYCTFLKHWWHCLQASALFLAGGCALFVLRIQHVGSKTVSWSHQTGDSSSKKTQMLKAFLYACVQSLSLPVTS